MTADVDIDFADRKKILELLGHTPARQENNGEIQKHNSGVYVTDIPYDPMNDCAAIDYRVAEERGYFKIDFLNVYVYSLIRDIEHYNWILNQSIPWDKLNNSEFVEQIVHLGNHYYNMQKMPEPIDSIERLAMFLAIIRPGKNHLLGKSWKEVAQTVWHKTSDGYAFKKSHAVAYAHLVALHMRLIHFSDKSD